MAFYLLHNYMDFIAIWNKFFYNYLLQTIFETNKIAIWTKFFMITSAKYGLKKKIKGNAYHAFLVTYDGYLTVTDVDKFKNLMINGLGKNKAHGCGLMTVI